MSGHKEISVVIGAQAVVHAILPAADSAGVSLCQRVEGRGVVLYWPSPNGSDVQFTLNPTMKHNRRALQKCFAWIKSWGFNVTRIIRMDLMPYRCILLTDLITKENEANKSCTKMFYNTVNEEITTLKRSIPNLKWYGNNKVVTQVVVPVTFDSNFSLLNSPIYFLPSVLYLQIS